jgi:large subunit ribosomal protein L4
MAERRSSAAPKAPVLGKQSKATLPAEVFGESFHPSLVYEVSRAEAAARRRGTASTLGRGEVSMTGAKAWRQKGTGRARVGALSVPQRRGGGVAFGPKPHSHVVKVNRKARRRALRAALSLHADRGSIAICDPSKWDTPSTKQAAEALAGFGEGRALVVIGKDGENGCAKSFRNIRGVSVLSSDQVGVADIVGAARLILSQSALDHLTALASAGSQEEAAE